VSTATRDKVVDTAIELFYVDGYHAIGVDRILAESGVEEAALAEHFDSKDELILAALKTRDARFRADTERELERRTDDPAERLVLLFDLLGEWFSEPDFSGCMFINVAGDYAKRPEDPIHIAAAEHKQLFLQYLRGQAEAAGASDPDELAAQLALLMEGAITTAHVSGPQQAATNARQIATQLVEQATDAG
jgi:AcrR family transcriptional regulator